MQVSILMPAFNAERYIPEAIESVLSQTHKDFEFVIINDGSTDNTLSVIEAFAKEDNRIKLISQANAGIVATLNRGLALVSNEWVVRMDADDVMLPNRLERQIAFVQQNPDLAVGGTLLYYINESGRLIGKSPRSPLETRAGIEEYIQHNKLKGKNDLEALPTVGFPHFMLTHATAVMRRSVIEEVGGYRQEFWPVEDFDLWNRIIEHGYTMLIQPEYLYKYRRYGPSASTARTRLTSLKIDWGEDCAYRRRSGQSELSWEEFLAVRQQAPWYRRLNQERMDLAKVLYNTARSHFSRRKYHLFAPALLAATLLQPSFVLPRVLSFRYSADQDGSSQR